MNTYELHFIRVEPIHAFRSATIIGESKRKVHRTVKADSFPAALGKAYKLIAKSATPDFSLILMSAWQGDEHLETNPFSLLAPSN